MREELTSGKAPVAFICRDYMLDDMLDELSADLERKNIEVIRGPISRHGNIIDYEPSTWSTLFGRADVAMFSSRSRCTSDVLSAAPSLRGIVNPTIGTETVDVTAATARGIVVGHGAVPENFESMAEAAIMLVLNLRYQLAEVRRVMTGERERPVSGASGALSQMVKGSTIGLIGFGRIGKAIAQKLQSFNAHVLAHSRSLNSSNAEYGVEAVELDALMSRSDVVILAVAINDSSKKIINERTLGLMKPNAYLINVSRGDAIDQQELVRVLRNRSIAGAALDTFEIEPLPKEHDLRQLDNVILTPHMVGHTREAYAAIAPTAMGNLGNLLKGKAPIHTKNPEAFDAWRRRLATLPTFAGLDF